MNPTKNLIFGKFGFEVFQFVIPINPLFRTMAT
jgi:hypothetical protein